MRFQLFLLSFIVSLIISPMGMADNICTKEAIEDANKQYLQDIASQTGKFANKQNNIAVAELNKIKPTSSFKKKHAHEIKQFNEPDYQPSQLFCDDLYANLTDLKAQLTEVLDKHTLEDSE